MVNEHLDGTDGMRRMPKDMLGQKRKLSVQKESVKGGNAGERSQSSTPAKKAKMSNKPTLFLKNKFKKAKGSAQGSKSFQNFPEGGQGSRQ